MSHPGDFATEYTAYEDWDMREYGYERLDVDRKLEPIRAHLAQYDQLRQKIFQERFSRADISDLVGWMQKPIEIKGFHGAKTVCLKEGKEFRRAIQNIHFEIHLSTRNVKGFPSYYICQTKHNYFGSYGLIIKDHYASPDYFTEHQFAHLMVAGRTHTFLRLSDFRNRAEGILASQTGKMKNVDHLLFEVGRYVFQDMWHPHQRMMLMLDKQLNLRQHREITECLYLWLTGNMYLLRDHISEPFLAFFKTVYPQKALATFLSQLRKWEGVELDNLVLKVSEIRAPLERAFTIFLNTPVPWQTGELPLYKIVYANFWRLDRILPPLRNHSNLVQSRDYLEKNAKVMLSHLLG